MTDVTALPASENLTLPLSIYDSFRIGTMRDRGGAEFAVVAGLDHYLVEQLKARSLDESDEAIQKHTSDRQRFGEGSYEKWYGKKRVPFALVHEGTNALAGLVWFGPKPPGRKSLRYLSEHELKSEHAPIEDAWHTIVYRSYAPYRGTGLMTAFTRFCLGVYRRQFPHVKFWAGISDNNPASITLAQKLGFVRSDEYSDPGAEWSAYTWEPDTL